MNIEDFRLLYDYNAWADHRTLEACKELTGEQFTHDLGSSFRSVRDTLLHIMLVEWLWLERWHGRSPNTYPPILNSPTLIPSERAGRKLSAICLTTLHRLPPKKCSA